MKNIIEFSFFNESIQKKKENKFLNNGLKKFIRKDFKQFTGKEISEASDKEISKYLKYDTDKDSTIFNIFSASRNLEIFKDRESITKLKSDKLFDEIKNWMIEEIKIKKDNNEKNENEKNENEKIWVKILIDADYDDDDEKEVHKKFNILVKCKNKSEAEKLIKDAKNEIRTDNIADNIVNCPIYSSVSLNAKAYIEKPKNFDREYQSVKDFNEAC